MLQGESVGAPPEQNCWTMGPLDEPICARTKSRYHDVSTGQLELRYCPLSACLGTELHENRTTRHKHKVLYTQRVCEVKLRSRWLPTERLAP